MSKLELVARALSGGGWRSGSALARLQHRFGASILLLRKGDYDGVCWEIEKRRAGVGVWEYRLTGRTLVPYQPHSPYCCDCGSIRIAIRDDRQ